MPTVMSAKLAREQMLRGEAPAGLIAHGSLVFDGEITLAHLPEDLEVDYLSVRDCEGLRALPPGLRCTSLNISGTSLVELPPDLHVADGIEARGCAQLTAVPSGLRLQALDLSGCMQLTELPADLHVFGRLDVSGCVRLKRLPDIVQAEWVRADGCVHLEELPVGLVARQLSLVGCTSLRALPDRLEAQTLDISGCTALEEWPSRGLRTLRQLIMRNCWHLRTLPRKIRALEGLDITGCTGLRELPDRLRITSWMEVADTSLQRIPPSAHGRLRWRGVRIPDRIALRPETITTQDALDERNAEVRRVMIECMGFERFMYEAGAEILDEDFDPGGPRQLLRVAFPNDEPLVCLAVYDPSTGRQYLLRVPPQMRSCRQAAAWVAGFDDPDDYHPAAET